MKLQKLLLTTDLSEEAERPYAAVQELARTNGASITLLHVVEDLAIAPHGAPLAPPIHAPDLSSLVTKAKETIQDHAKKLGEGIEIHTEVITGGQVAQAIADFAEEGGYDLLALSSHGRSGFRRLVMGSVAETVLRHVRIPVLVFPR